ncbi:MAG: alpha-isopropylmalate synthase regulatory domain-containing protein [Patescibacteria group bacterium]
MVNQLVADSTTRERVFAKVAEREQFGYEYSNANASLELLVARVVNGKKLPFEAGAYHVSMRGALNGCGNEHVCEASLKVIVGGAIFHEVAEGDGPVDALDQALRLALGKSHLPSVTHIKLVDYSVGLVLPAAGVKAKTRVFIVVSDGKATWRTEGVSQNIVEASGLALSDGYEYALLRRVQS